MAAKEIGRQLRQTIIVALGATVFARHVTALHIAGFFQALPKEGQAQWIVQPPGRNTEEPYHRHRRLLRSRRERPRGGTAEQRDEFAPTSSPRSFDHLVGAGEKRTFEAITSSYLVGACTDKFSRLRNHPLFMRATLEKL
jgi:hypothetical protein